jgi:hypothetical protein
VVTPSALMKKGITGKVSGFGFPQPDLPSCNTVVARRTLLRRGLHQVGQRSTVAFIHGDEERPHPEAAGRGENGCPGDCHPPVGQDDSPIGWGHRPTGGLIQRDGQGQRVGDRGVEVHIGGIGYADGGGQCCARSRPVSGPLTLLHPPQSHRLVPTSRGKYAPIGAKGHALHQVRVSLQLPHLPAPLDIP